MTQKLGASDQSGLQIRMLHRKMHRVKEKNILFLYDLKTQKFRNISPNARKMLPHNIEIPNSI